MDKKVRKYRKIDEHSYNAIKTLINTGLSGREIQRAMNISQTTFWRIKTSETLEEYRQLVSEKNYPQKYLSEKERPHCLTSAAFPKESVFPDNQRICSLTLAFLPLKDLR